MVICESDHVFSRVEKWALAVVIAEWLLKARKDLSPKIIKKSFWWICLSNVDDSSGEAALCNKCDINQFYSMSMSNSDTDNESNSDFESEKQKLIFQCNKWRKNEYFNLTIFFIFYFLCILIFFKSAFLDLIDAKIGLLIYSSIYLIKLRNWILREMLLKLDTIFSYFKLLCWLLYSY